MTTQSRMSLQKFFGDEVSIRAIASIYPFVSLVFTAPESDALVEAVLILLEKSRYVGLTSGRGNSLNLGSGSDYWSWQITRARIYAY